MWLKMRQKGSQPGRQWAADAVIEWDDEAGAFLLASFQADSAEAPASKREAKDSKPRATTNKPLPEPETDTEPVVERTRVAPTPPPAPRRMRR